MRYGLLRICILLKRLLLPNHWRGHGIHSPFMYRLVRETVMNKGLRCEPRALPRELCDCGLKRRDRLFLERLYGYLDYGNCIAVGSGATVGNGTLCIAPPGATVEIVEKLVAEMKKRHEKCCMAITGVNRSYGMYRFCRRMARERNCASVDIYRTYLFFFDGGLQKQHYKLSNGIIG